MESKPAEISLNNMNQREFRTGENVPSCWGSLRKIIQFIKTRTRNFASRNNKNKEKAAEVDNFGLNGYTLSLKGDGAM